MEMGYHQLYEVSFEDPMVGHGGRMRFLHDQRRCQAAKMFSTCGQSLGLRERPKEVTHVTHSHKL